MRTTGSRHSILRRSESAAVVDGSNARSESNEHSRQSSLSIPPAIVRLAWFRKRFDISGIV